VSANAKSGTTTSAGDDPSPLRARIHAVFKWGIIASLAALTILAAAFWTLILGDFAGAGFRVAKRDAVPDDALVITPECAWPYGVNDHEARPVCRMFYNMTPEQQALAVRSRK
jgi:hypothetical protein